MQGRHGSLPRLWSSPVSPETKRLQWYSSASVSRDVEWYLQISTLVESSTAMIYHVRSQAAMLQPGTSMPLVSSELDQSEYGIVRCALDAAQVILRRSLEAHHRINPSASRQSLFEDIKVNVTAFQGGYGEVKAKSRTRRAENKVTAACLCRRR